MITDDLRLGRFPSECTLVVPPDIPELAGTGQLCSVSNFPQLGPADSSRVAMALVIVEYSDLLSGADLTDKENGFPGLSIFEE